jgi:hypothetical protein
MIEGGAFVPFCRFRSWCMVPLRRSNDGEMKGISRAFHTRAEGTDPAESGRARAEADY